MENSKEIKFLHNFCQLIEEDPDLDTLYSKLISILPDAMTYSKKCLCTLQINSQTFGNNKNCSYENGLKEKIFTKGEEIGHISVCYYSPHLSFTPDESELIKYTCKRLGRIIERYQSEMKLRGILFELEKKLDMKNIALAEIMDQISNSKSDYKKNINNFIHTNILPNIIKLEEKVGGNFYLEILKLNMERLVTDEDNILFKFSQLSQRELECCFLIEKGYTSKEIGGRLLISSKTVSKHRANIRKKLGIVGSNKNLYTSLKYIDQR